MFAGPDAIYLAADSLISGPAVPQGTTVQKIRATSQTTAAALQGQYVLVASNGTKAAIYERFSAAW